jgi:hypothetical protein
MSDENVVQRVDLWGHANFQDHPEGTLEKSHFFLDFDYGIFVPEGATNINRLVATLTLYA